MVFILPHAWQPSGSWHNLKPGPESAAAMPALPS